MKEILRIALAQINCLVGDLAGNRAKIIEYLNQARGIGSDIIVFPELAITGYPPEDLLLKPKFIQDNLESLKGLALKVKDILVIVGFVDREADYLYNAAGLIHDGRLKGVYHKMHLPNYGVFDEKRYFKEGLNCRVFKFGGAILGVNICEDIWHKDGPIGLEARYGAKLILNLNASPYYAGKIKERLEIIKRQARANKVFIGYVNLVGGQDELVFDGQSVFVDSQGNLIAQAQAFKEDLLIVDINLAQSKIGAKRHTLTIAQRLAAKDKPPVELKKIKPLDLTAEIYQALVLGLRDYVTKNSFNKVVIGLSGGIDSSLVAALAADALGSENVIGVFMPSQYSSQESKDDAMELAKNLQLKFLDIPIAGIYEVYLKALETQFLGTERNVAEENLQARIRGNILMALSNKFGWLVLTTGNKSELSTGYATLYGDMAGGFAVIKDVPKTYVYKLARYRNSLGFIIPERVLTKEPTAELKPEQKDRDTLPPYETLDPILKAYVEEDKSPAKIISLGFAKETISKVLNMVDKSEYKRRQSPPGIKITPKAFGRDRRMPITNKYRS